MPDECAQWTWSIFPFYNPSLLYSSLIGYAPFAYSNNYLCEHGPGKQRMRRFWSQQGSAPPANVGSGSLNASAVNVRHLHGAARSCLLDILNGVHQAASLRVHQSGRRSARAAQLAPKALARQGSIKQLWGEQKANRCKLTSHKRGQWSFRPNGLSDLNPAED